MTSMGRHTHSRHTPRMRVSSTPRFLGSITNASGILDRPPSRTMTTEYDSAISRREAPGVLLTMLLALQSEGAGKTGCALHPRSRVQSCTRVRTRAYRSSGEHPAFPAQWLYGLCRALPGEPSSVATVAPEKLASQELGASFGRQNHTILPYASAPFVTKSASASTASRPTSVTIASAPLSEQDGSDIG
jgi:hypothetical protein